MGIIKFLKCLADDDPIKEQKSMVDAAKFEVDRIDADSDRGNPGGIGDFGFTGD